MKKRIFGWVSGLCLLVACSTPPAQKTENTVVRPMLVHPLFFNEETAQCINFPFWFNDSMLVAQNIKTVNWTYFGSVLDDDDQNDRIERLPKKKLVYSFSNTGFLSHLQQTDFFEGVIISNQSFSFRGTKWPYYVQVLRNENRFGVENSTQLLAPVKRKPNALQFDNETKTERWHFITKTKFHGALSVDSITAPRPNDWVVLGTPHRPLKRYKVWNKVKEKQVTTFTYWNGNYPKSIVSDDYPFTRKRSFEYSNGRLNGFIDSTFIDNHFVTDVATTIFYNKEGLPVKIVRKKGHGKDSQTSASFETISYERFKQL